MKGKGSTPNAPGSVDAGLRHRMGYERTRIHSQHTQLADLHAMVIRALGRAEVHSARQSFSHFEDALLAHLEVEERIYFPAIHGLRPDFANEIAELVAEHEIIVGLLPRVHGLLGGGEMEVSADALSDLARQMSQHERREEALLRRCSEQHVP